MAGKRKRASGDLSHTAQQRKRSRLATLADVDGSPGEPIVAHPHGQFDESQEYQIRAIVDETRTHFRIEWEDDEATGQAFKPTWEPKEFANDLARADWEETKKQRRTAAREAAKKPPAPRGRGRPRKVIESSPPPEPDARVDGDTEQAESRVEDLEIGESQPTVAGATEGPSDAGSPLFEPADSPKPQNSGQPTVHISDPPSSYAAGGYQAFSSSQLPDSVAPKRRRSASVEAASSSQPTGEGEEEEQASAVAPPRRSPEPSQFQPEEGDTSNTTEDTTEISLAPTSSSAHTRSISVNFGESSRFVPDSQSLPDSASFIPSTSHSLSAPDPAGRGRPPAEVAAVDLQSQVQEEQSSWQGFSSQPAAASTQVARRAEGEGLQREEASQAQSSGHEALFPNDSSRSQEEGLQSSKVPSDHQEQDRSRPAVSGSAQYSPKHTLESNGVPVSGQSQPSLVEQAERGTLGEDQRSGASHPSSTASQRPPNSSGLDKSSFNRQNSSQPLQSTQGSEQSQPPRKDVRESTEQAETSHVDLTADTQQSVTDTRSITVTPLPARHTLAGQRDQHNTHPGQIWQSPFPFQTQVSRHFSSTASGASAGTQGLVGNQRPVQSQPNTHNSLEINHQASGPTQRSTQLRTSSPIPPAPSQSLGTFAVAASAPPRPRTPSSPVRPSSNSPMMEASQASASTLDKIKAMRAQKRAKLAAERSATPTSAPAAPVLDSSPPKSSIPPHVLPTAPVSNLNLARLASPLLQAHDRARSPSAVPAIEALPEITTKEMNTSERYPTLLPQASVDGERPRHASTAGRTTPTQQRAEKEDPEMADVHDVPVALVGHQRDQYPQMVYYHQDLIQTFLASSSATSGPIISQQIERFLERMRSITLHPDLDNPETFTQYDVEPSQQAAWDVNCSAKFRFLKALLESLRNEDMHVVIVLGNSQLVSILRTFLRGTNITSGQPSLAVDPASLGAGKLSVTVSTNHDPVVAAVHLVIGLDNSFRHDHPLVRSLRRSNKWCPFIKLVVPHSIEHIENHLSTGLSDRAKTRALVSAISQLKNEAGRLEEGQTNPTDSATAIADYLKKKSREDQAWPLVGLGSLKDLDSQTESEIEPADEMVISPTAGDKRQHDDSDQPDELDLSKRVRMEPVAEHAAIQIATTVNPQDVELAHISDSVHKPTQSNATGEDLLTTDTERQLQRLLQIALNRNEELSAALSDLQYRHEDARTILIRTTSERDQAAATAEAAAIRLSKAADKATELRDERTELKQQLEDAQARLLAHAVPERAELEAERSARAQATAEKEMLARRLEAERKQSEFFRTQYQDASTTASREVAANAELRDQLAVAAARATGEQARLRQLAHDVRAKQLGEENRRLKAVLRDRDAGLKFRDEEIAKLKEASRGRMGTRGTSVPRSPRLGSPMGVRSRQGSPAVGEGKGRSSLLHPLRNNA